MTLQQIENRLTPLMSILFGSGASCKAGSKFFYIWWGRVYTVHSSRYTKAQAQELLRSYELLFEEI